MVYSAEELKAWDAFTMEEEGISFSALMERAARACTEYLLKELPSFPSYTFFCGPGHNGGDGKVMARLLRERGLEVHVYAFEPDREPPEAVPSDGLLIDALWGSGLNRPLEGNAAAWVTRINAFRRPVLSIDLPSGLLPDGPTPKEHIVKAALTLTLGAYKTALLLPENAPFIGEVELLTFGLHPGYPERHPSRRSVLDAVLAASIYCPRSRFAHKGTYGHALLIGGSTGKAGAVLMAAGACLRGGAGLTTVMLPESGYLPLQTALPEAMLLTGAGKDLIERWPGEAGRYAAAGIGPGLGTAEATAGCLESVLREWKGQLVLDADALNLLARHPHWWSLLPENTVLTPHPREFDRLLGASTSDWERLQKAESAAREHRCIIILKGHHTLIALPGGRSYFNMSGNPGMAKGGSGDVLTGLLTALLAQGYDPVQAALLGVYLHGQAGDLAAATWGEEAMLPTDLTAHLGKAFSSLRS